MCRYVTFSLPLLKITLEYHVYLRKKSVWDGKGSRRFLLFFACIFVFIIHQIFFARAIGLNTSRDAAKTGEYQMIFPK